ncbi:MAG: methyltransferase domain-containing protein [bacterium]
MTDPGSEAAGPASCPVCRGRRVGLFLAVGGRGYWRCDSCAATFLDRADLPGPEAEAARYREHRNDPDDPGYLAHLRRLADPMLARLPPVRAGLDYGCGPSPALARLFTAAGHSVRRYDPLFCPERAALRATYDFIACSEVAEHFHRPALEFARLDRLLRPGGLLGVMTRFLVDDGGFANWHYRRDPTHVVFYKPETFRLLAARLGWDCELPGPDVALMRRPASRTGS